ncbi:MAG: LacI family transcriptional regulator [Actinomycetia bacterium]|nr:LacI family transcriptional regulator [Actinomycetes bacterium]
MANPRVTLDDVARAAGVSRATASRALSGDGSAASATRERVRLAARELGFAPNQAARTLAGRRTEAIALVIPEPDALVLADPFLTGMIVGVSEAFHTTPYQLILVIVRPDEPAVKNARVLRPDYVDGAIIVSHHRSGAISQLLTDNDIPAVFVGRPWVRADKSVMYVDVDNVTGGRLATQRLLDGGAARIACLAGPSDMTPVMDRTAGWHQALDAAGRVGGPLEHAPFTLQGGVNAMRAILRRDAGVDGVFAQSDLLAVGAMQALAEAGRSVPHDVKVVGVDDAAVARTSIPPLTTVTNPAAELAVAASRMLMRAITDGADPHTLEPEILVPTLIARDSA